MLAAEGVTAFRSERQVLRDVSFCVAPGGALVLRGANGAGKSTLLHILAGLLRPDAGVIRWNGTDIADDTEGLGRNIAYVGHQDGVKPGLTVAENLRFAAQLAALRGRRPSDPAAALAALGIGHLMDCPARMLSAGQRRRVALARLPLLRARLWLLDEPLNALDEQAASRFAELLAEHRAGGGLAVLSSHDATFLPEAGGLALSGSG